MIEAIPTKDFSYIKEVIASPGMKKRLTAGLPAPDNMDEYIQNPDITYLKVLKDGSEKGFVSFHKTGEDGAAQIHVALKTSGNDTVIAIRQCISFERDNGIRTIYAVYPSNRRSIHALADGLGFEKLPDIGYLGLNLSVRKLTT
jgi:hypothetical protein